MTSRLTGQKGNAQDVGREFLWRTIKTATLVEDVVTLNSKKNTTKNLNRYWI